MLPATAFQFSASRTELSVLLPQGWDFFTRNPREPQLRAYAEHEGKWDSAMVGPKARPGLAYGWIRSPRAQLVEMGHILKSAENFNWTLCPSGTLPSTCFTNETTRTEEITNESPHPTLCGNIAFVSQELMPWAWASEGLNVIMSSKILRLKILCSK